MAFFDGHERLPYTLLSVVVALHSSRWCVMDGLCACDANVVYESGEVMRSDFEFFWNGPCSQWHDSTFEVDNVEYNCAEQYMMAGKAGFFEDEAILELAR